MFPLVVAKMRNFRTVPSRGNSTFQRKVAAILVGFSEAGLGGRRGDRAVVLGQVSPLSKKLEVSALREGGRANSMEFQTEHQGQRRLRMVLTVVYLKTRPWRWFVWAND